jgi:hypothetical protein
MAEKEREPSEKIQQLLKKVADTFDMEDRAVRERQIRIWRRLKLYWNGFQNVYWSEVAHDWRIYDEQQFDNTDQSYYDKPVNVYRAYLESIIAALSITVPAIKCYPDDADNPLDLDTAKAGDEISKLIYMHNNVIQLWLHALYIYCTEGMIACYSYPKEDEEYGTYETPDYEDAEELQYVCPTCGSPLDAELFTNREIDEYMPEDDDVILHDDILNKGMTLCPNCAAMLDPNMQPEHHVVQRLVGHTSHPKTRQCMEVYGGLYIKIPNYAKTQKDIPYLRFSYETHYSNVLERYGHLRDRLSGGNKIGPTSSGIYDPYEAWGRLSTQYNGEYPINTTTVNNYWFRASAFNVLNEEDAKILRAKYPDGCKYVKINECFAEAENESLDDCWTIAQNPLSDYLHFDPLGLFLTSIQDITNDLVSLTLQTIEHGIPQTFADPGVLNFDEYRQTEVLPGGVYPASPKSGKSVGDAFFITKTATLSGEILPFGNNIQSLGQLISGATPSIYGGQASEGSKTASEYAMSRANALQRLQTPWKMLTLWWKDIFGKVIPSYIKEIVEDEKLVEKDEQGNFVNRFIRKAELNGKIGKIELEASEQLPITWGQKKDIIMQFLQGGNPLILEALTSPENLPFIKEAVGLPEFVIPGEADRNKEYEEIQQLISSEPIQIPPDPMMMQAAMMGDPNAQMMMQQGPQEVPSVEVDPDLDNHMIGSEIDRNWLIGDAGRLAKIENPQGYKNVLLHYKMHKQFLAMQQAMMQPPPPDQSKGASNGGGQKETSEVAPNNKGDNNGGIEGLPIQ